MRYIERQMGLFVPQFSMFVYVGDVVIGLLLNTTASKRLPGTGALGIVPLALPLTVRKFPVNEIATVYTVCARLTAAREGQRERELYRVSRNDVNGSKAHVVEQQWIHSQTVAIGRRRR